MKLSEILKEAAENPELQRWLTENKGDYYWSSVDDGEEDYDADEVYELLMTMKDARANLDEFLFWFKFNFHDKEITKCPIDGEDWIKVFGNQIDIIEYSNAKITDAKLLLNAAGNLKFEKCHIESLKLEKDFFANRIELNNCVVNCGLLSLLQCKDVHSIEVKNSGTALEKAVDIVNKHLKGDRNIVECQGDLIDAELEEFAKL